MKRTGWLIGLVLAGAGVCLGQLAPTVLPADPTAQTAEGKIVQDMFGKRIAEAAKGKLKDEDAVAVTNQLLAAANDGSASGQFKLALAMSALRVSVTIGSEESGRLAHKALDMIQSASPLGAGDKAFYLKEISVRRLAKGKAEHLSTDEMQVLAKSALELSMSYVEAAMGDDNSAAEAASVLRQARLWISQYKLKEYTQSLDDLEKKNKAATVRRVRLKDALARLDTVTRAKDAEGIKAASKAVAGVYLETEGDLRASAKYYAGADDARGKVVLAAVDVLDHPKPLNTKKALETIEGLIHLIDSLTDVAKINASKTALELGELYMGSDPPETAAAKVKLAMVQWQSVAGSSEGDKIKKELSLAYGTIQGKLEAMSSGRVRLSYDFANQAELNDWDTLGGTWEVGKNMLGCKTTSHDKYGSIECRLPFRQDKPFKVTFSGVARHELTAKLFVTTWKSGHWRDPPTVIFKLLDDDGLRCYSFEREWKDGKTLLLSEKPYKFELSSEGDGNVTWSVNGAEVHVFMPSEDNAKAFKGSFKLVLQTRGADRTPSLFDGVVIEGTILPNPDYVPEEYKKADSGDDTGKPVRKPRSN